MSLLARLGLGGTTANATDPNDIVAAVRARLGRLPADRAEMVAAFAGLLMRVAHADETVSDTEASALRHLVREHSGLSPDEAEAVVDLLARRAEGFGGIEYAQLTRAMNEHATPNDKLHLLDCLYEVAAADGLATIVEEEQIRAVARALMLSHGQLIEVRRRHAAALEVLQRPRSS